MAASATLPAAHFQISAMQIARNRCSSLTTYLVERSTWRHQASQKHTIQVFLAKDWTSPVLSARLAGAWSTMLVLTPTALSRPRLRLHQCSSKRGFKMWILITSPHTVLGYLQMAGSLPQSRSKYHLQSSVSRHTTLYLSPWARWITPSTFFKVFSTQIQTTITGSSHR